jgi:hypothetical protein
MYILTSWRPITNVRPWIYFVLFISHVDGDCNSLTSTVMFHLMDLENILCKALHLVKEG